MGAALAAVATELGHDVVIVSGPVSVDYPAAAKLIRVVTTDEMLEAALREFDTCDGAIGAAAPCDYKPRFVNPQKLSKTGEPLALELIETEDVVASLGQVKRDHQWVVGFALETADRRFRATVKLERKHCDLIVSNGPQAIDSDHNEIELIDRHGNVVCHVAGDKRSVAARIVSEIDARLIQRTSTTTE